MSQSEIPSSNTDQVKFPTDSLEARAIRTDAQKLRPAGPAKRLRGKTGVFYHFTALGAARSVITKAYSAEELKCLSVVGAKTGENDSVSGPKISSFARDFGKIQVGGEARSGRHPRQSIDLSDGAISVVIATSFGQTLEIDPRKVLQEEQKQSGSL